VTDLFDIERDAQRLERHLASGVSAEVQLLVGLGFFRLLRDSPHLCDPDPYLLQFLPRLASAATKADPEGFFPDEADALSEFAEWVRQVASDTHPDARDAIARLASASQDFLRVCVNVPHSDETSPCHPDPALARAEGSALPARGGKQQILSAAADSESGRGHGTVRAAPQEDRGDHGRARLLPSQSLAGVERGSAGASPSHPQDAGAFDDTSAPVTLNCLFVEHFPDLDLPPRGRLLKLNVTATTISKKADSDDVMVRNPVTKPDDRFLAQARDSVRAARACMHRRYGLPLAKRYRFDFAVDSSGARFTGDSLGVAFAAGAIAALGKVEVLRERLAISPDVAFSGALSANGNLSPVDGGALKHKIDRAFFSRLKFLVIPRENITEAWTYLSTLESRYPSRKLELVGADALDTVAGDPRLVPRERISSFGYAARRAWKAKRAPAVEVSVLVAAVAILLFIMWPYFDRNPASVRITGNGFEAVNKFGKRLWAKMYPCDSLFSSLCWAVVDLNGDGSNEVLFSPEAGHLVGKGTWLEVLKSNGDTLFSRDMVIRNEYVGDSVPPDQPVYYTPYVTVAHLKRGPLIITGAFQHDPARQHIKIWAPDGRLKGWYINAGGVSFGTAGDLTGDLREELIFLAFNNRMGCSGVFAIRADSSYGCSPPYRDSEYAIDGIIRGNQVHYTLFPVTDVGCIDLAQGYNAVMRVGRMTDGMIRADIAESDGWLYREVDYYLDSNLCAVRVDVSDQFRKRREALLVRDSVSEIPWGEYLDELRDRVTYWRDTTWVTEGQLRAR